MITDAQVLVTARNRANPDRRIERTATIDAATNKLLCAAVLEIPNAGLWEMTVTIDRPLGQASSRFEVEVAEPLPPWASLWPWLTWPALIIVAFGVHQWRAAREVT